MKKQCKLCRIPHCRLKEGESVLDCPINKFLRVLGGKWTFIVLLVLEKPHRFGMLKKNIPDISEKVLITTLKMLEDNGFLTKEKITGKHLQSTYTITENGKKALAVAESMAMLGKNILL